MDIERPSSSNVGSFISSHVGTSSCGMKPHMCVSFCIGIAVLVAPELAWLKANSNSCEAPDPQVFFSSFRIMGQFAAVCRPKEASEAHCNCYESEADYGQEVDVVEAVVMPVDWSAKELAAQVGYKRSKEVVSAPDTCRTHLSNDASTVTPPPTSRSMGLESDGTIRTVSEWLHGEEYDESVPAEKNPETCYYPEACGKEEYANFTKYKSLSNWLRDGRPEPTCESDTTENYFLFDPSKPDN